MNVRRWAERRRDCDLAGLRALVCELHTVLPPTPEARSGAWTVVADAWAAAARRAMATLRDPASAVPGLKTVGLLAFLRTPWSQFFARFVVREPNGRSATTSLSNVGSWDVPAEIAAGGDGVRLATAAGCFVNCKASEGPISQVSCATLTPYDARPGGVAPGACPLGPRSVMSLCASTTVPLVPERDAAAFVEALRDLLVTAAEPNA